MPRNILMRPLKALAFPGIYLYCKFSEYKRQRQERSQRKLTEKELVEINYKIDKLLDKLDEKFAEKSDKPEEECLICVNAKAIIQTYPCGHKVVCRRCFVKMIQASLSQKMLPLRCIICRSRITRLQGSKNNKYVPTSCDSNYYYDNNAKLICKLQEGKSTRVLKKSSKSSIFRQYSDTSQFPKTRRAYSQTRVESTKKYLPDTISRRSRSSCNRQPSCTTDFHNESCSCVRIPDENPSKELRHSLSVHATSTPRDIMIQQFQEEFRRGKELSTQLRCKKKSVTDVTSHRCSVGSSLPDWNQGVDKRMIEIQCPKKITNIAISKESKSIKRNKNKKKLR